MADPTHIDIPQVQQLGDIYLFDLRHMDMQGMIGSYLLPGEGGAFALVECGPASTLDHLEAAIRAAGYEPKNLSDVLVTHIHLDHAAAAGTLARRYGARVVVHERGAKHLADPERLLKSATRIYGERMNELWGVMEAVPEAQLHAVSDGDTLNVSGQRLRVLYTPGHASHHVSYLLDDGTLFTGDAAAIKLTGSSVIRPALPPPEVNLETWDETLETMKAANPSRLLLTHFGQVLDAQAHLSRVSERNHEWAELIREGMEAGEDDDALINRLAAKSVAELEADGATPDVIARHRVTSNDEMTIAGVTRYWTKKLEND